MPSGIELSLKMKDRVMGLLVCAALIGAPVLVLQPAPVRSAAPAPSDEARRAFTNYRTSIERALIQSDPDARRFFQMVKAAEDGREQVTLHRPVEDMDSDGVRDVLVERFRFTRDPVGLALSGDSRAQVLSGRTGELLWTTATIFQAGSPSSRNGFAWRAAPRACSSSLWQRPIIGRAEVMTTSRG